MDQLVPPTLKTLFAQPRMLPPSNGTMGSAVPWMSSTGIGAGSAFGSAARKLSGLGIVALITVARAKDSGISWMRRMTIWPPLEYPTAKTRRGSMLRVCTSRSMTVRVNETSSTPSTRAGKSGNETGIATTTCRRSRERPRFTRCSDWASLGASSSPCSPAPASPRWRRTTTPRRNWHWFAMRWRVRSHASQRRIAF
jgi:hypothetical protein